MNQSKAEYYKTLPSKRMGSGILFFNKERQILLVQPTYKETWEIPGGVVELNESPRDAALREVKEELGLQLNPDAISLLCVEYMAAGNEKTEALMFVFNGGILEENQLNQIKLDASEIKSYQFVALNNLIDLLVPMLGARIQKCVEASSCIYSEGQY